MEIKNLGRSNSLLILIGVLSIFTFISILVGCDTSGDDFSSSDDKLDLDDKPQYCSTRYIKYIDCTRKCNVKGTCLENCIDFWYVEFLECCDDFDAETACRYECLAGSYSCFDACEEDNQSEHKDCYDNFSECLQGCPVPIFVEDTEENESD